MRFRRVSGLGNPTDWLGAGALGPRLGLGLPAWRMCRGPAEGQGSAKGLPVPWVPESGGRGAGSWGAEGRAAQTRAPAGGAGRGACELGRSGGVWSLPRGPVRGGERRRPFILEGPAARSFPETSNLPEPDKKALARSSPLPSTGPSASSLIPATAPRSRWYHSNFVDDLFIRSVYKRACPGPSLGQEQSQDRGALVRTTDSLPGHGWSDASSIRPTSLNSAGLKTTQVGISFSGKRAGSF